jgi:hypothetical protein
MSPSKASGYERLQVFQYEPPFSGKPQYQPSRRFESTPASIIRPNKSLSCNTHGNPQVICRLFLMSCYNPSSNVHHPKSRSWLARGEWLWATGLVLGPVVFLAVFVAELSIFATRTVAKLSPKVIGRLPAIKAAREVSQLWSEKRENLNGITSWHECRRF